MATEDRDRTYATAFYESAWEHWLTTLTTVAEKLEQGPDLRGLLHGTGTDFAQRQRMLDSILPPDVDLPVRNFLYTLLQRNDLYLLNEIITALRQQIRGVETGPIEVEVVSAVPLSDEERQTLVAKLQQQSGNNLDIHYRVDPSILGGLVIRIGDKLIDSSVAKRLATIKQTLGVSATT